MDEHDEPRDAHLSLRWESRDGWEAINSALDQAGATETRAAIASALCAEAIGAGRQVSYSRRRKHYSVPRRYHSRLYTYDRVVPAVDWLHQQGLIDHTIAKPGQRGWQSTMCAKPELVELVEDALHGNITVLMPPETIILRDSDKRPVDYRDTRETHRMRRGVEAQNEAIANAKGEIFDGLDQGDCAVINADLPWAASWRERAGAASVIDFGLEESAAITAIDVRPLGVKGVSFTALTPAGSMPVTLALPGVHNVANALATTAVALACGLDLTQIRCGLEAVQPTAGRLATAHSPAGSTVIDDCYNANPGSVRAAIAMLAGCEGRRTLILGAMRELGPTSEALHREIGEYARTAGIERFWGVGPELQVAVDAFGSDACWFADCESAIDATAGEFNNDDTVLVKGSRGARMERVLHALLADEPAGEG